MKIMKGISVCPGKTSGVARIIEREEDIKNVSIGDIVILPYSHPMFILAVMNASAVICEVGGRLSHLCVVALEMGIPCITQIENISSVLKSGQQVIVNADEGEVIIYE